MDYTSLKGKGLTGLVNLGNTCYINSCLQIISHIPELNRYVGDYLNKNNDFDNLSVKFLKEWYDLYALMWKKNCIISPNRFIKYIHNISKEKKNELFSGFMQNDSTEFMYFILQIMDEALKSSNDDKYLLNSLLKNSNKDNSFHNFLKSQYKKCYSKIDELFTIYVRMDIVDVKTKKNLSHNYESFYILDLPIDSLHINDCLSNHFKDEEMNKQNNNQYYDDKENKYKDVLKKTSIYNTPPYLLLQLKRWNQNLKKNQRLIHYDIENLNITPFMCKNNMKKNCNYKLFGIINHSGNVFGGHYYSYIKSFDNKWYEFNDSNVKEISSSKLISNKNYCFIYRRKQ